MAFKRGGTVFPLTAATTNSMLEDADPALARALAFVAWCLRRYIGPRLLAQGLLEGLKWPDAVAKTLHVEPSPYLASDKFSFPLLAIYRHQDFEAEPTATYLRVVSEWEFAYVLGPLTPRQVEQIQPILAAAYTVISYAIARGYDPAYQGGVPVWTDLGVEGARVMRGDYGGYEPIDNISHYYRALVGTIRIAEREMPHLEEYEPFEGADVQLQEDTPTTSPVETISVSIFQPPAIASITPNSGTKAGGQSITITGERFHPGQPVEVQLGGRACGSCVVVDAQHITCTTPAHTDAGPLMIAEVVVKNLAGQTARRPAAYTFTSP